MGKIKANYLCRAQIFNWRHSSWPRFTTNNHNTENNLIFKLREEKFNGSGMGGGVRVNCVHNILINGEINLYGNQLH